MIFAIMGMEVHPFDRLARALDELQQALPGEEVFVQLGACTYEPKRARFQRYLSFGEVCEAVRRAEVVVTHAGAGSALVCIQQGKHPVVVPRRAAHGEHVDEHQVPFARKLAEGGLATVAHEMEDLPGAVELARRRAGDAAAMGRASELVAWLERFWTELPARRGA